MLKTPEITEEQGGGSPSGTAGQDFGEGEQNVQSVQTRVKDRFLGHEGEFTPSKGASGGGQNVETPIRAQERRTIGKPKISPFSAFKAPQILLNDHLNYSKLTNRAQYLCRRSPH
jgi:hypothetical protein